MIAYIAGPITGVDGYKEKFGEAQAVLERIGYVALNPAVIPEGLGDCDTYMKICLPMIEIADTVVLLDGWKNSRGACREWGYATALGKNIVEFEALATTSETLKDQQATTKRPKNTPIHIEVQ